MSSQSNHPSFDPAHFIRRMAASGVVLTETANGDLHARPGMQLTADDRVALRVHKNEIVAALADASR